MTAIKEMIDIMDTSLAYYNFGEEVEILMSTRTANDYTLYTVRNKNNITFHNVPGDPGLQDTGFIGFVGGDKNRPIIMAPGAKTLLLPIAATPPWTDTADIT